MENVTFVNSLIVAEIHLTFVSIGSTVKTNFGRIKILIITLITTASTAIRIGLIMLIFRVAVARLEDGVRQREGAFWMRQIIIVGQIMLKKTERVISIPHEGNIDSQSRVSVFYFITKYLPEMYVMN